MAIKLKLTGFDELLKDIEAAGGSVDRATESAMKQSAQIMRTELKSQMEKSDVPKDLIDKMPPFSVENDHGKITARVGYEKGAYDPKNPSAGYEVVFLNYGTPHRRKHGKVIARGFIQRAKKRANPKIKKAQQEALDKILSRLQK
jgi:HK97 gp10 family phage protein